MPVTPWALYGEEPGKANGSIATCCFTVSPPKGPPPAFAAATGPSQPAPRDARHRQQQQQQQQQQLISKVLKKALEEYSDEEEAAAPSSSSSSSNPVVVPPIFGFYPYDYCPSTAADVPSVLLRCKRAEEQQEALLLAAAAAVSAAMRQQLETIARMVRTQAALGALELWQQPPSISTHGSGRRGPLCEFLPFVIMHVGADVEDHRLAVRMLQLQLQQEAKCCCGGRRSSRDNRSNSANSSSGSKEDLFLRQVVLRSNNCTNSQAALRAAYGQLKGSSCCSTCTGRSRSSSSSSTAGKENTEEASVPEELAADAAADAAWGEPTGLCAQQQQLLLLQCLEGGGDDSSSTAQGAVNAAADDEEGGHLGHDISSKIGQLWRKQLQQHHRGFCCTWRRMGEGAAVRTRSQRAAAAGEDSDSSSRETSASEDSSDEVASSAMQGSSSSSSSSALVVVLEELEAFPPRVLSQLLLLLALLRMEQGIPVVVLGSAAASAVAVQQLLGPTTLRLLQIDATVLLRPSAVYDALLQLLLCCPASTPFVLPAAAIEELQELLLDQGSSVLQLLRVLRMLLYKFYADHPFSFLSVDARSVAAPSSSSSSDTKAEGAPAAAAAAAAPSGGSSDVEALERRLALLAAAVLTPQQEAALLQQISKFPLLHAELCAAAPTKLEQPCCRAWGTQQQQQQQLQQQQQQQQPAAAEDACNKTPTCGAVARARMVLQQWWGSPAVSAAADEKQSAASRRTALQQHVLPDAALQLVERRVAASVAMRLLVVLQQHVVQQRQAFALNAEETAAATFSSLGSGNALSAVSLLLQIIGGGRPHGYHDYLLQGQATSGAAVSRIVSLICEELRRVAGACCRVGGLVTTLVSEALSAAATTGRIAAVPHALLLAMKQFCRQSRREWIILQQLESRRHPQQPKAGPGRANELFRMMHKLIDMLQLTCQQQQQQLRGPDGLPAFVSGLARRATAGTSSLRRGTNSSSTSDSGLCSRVQSWARDCLLYLLLPLPQWHPLGCELGVWSLSYYAAEQPQCLAAALAVPKDPTHRAEAAAADALARLQPLRPIEVLQQLACLSSSALEYHQQSAGKDAVIVTDDTGLVYRRIAFGSRRIPLWTLFCLFCSDVIDVCVGQRPHPQEHQQQEQTKQQQQQHRHSSASTKGKRRGRKGNDIDKNEHKGGLSPARLALEMKALQQLQAEAGAGSSETNTPCQLLHHLFLRFGVAVCALEHIGLVRLPGAAASADDMLLRAAAAEGATASDAAAVSDAEAAADSEDASEGEGTTGTVQHQAQQQQSAADVAPTAERRKRPRKAGLALSDALQLQQQLHGLYLTRCFFGSVYLPEHQEEPQSNQQQNVNGERKLRKPTT